MGNVRQLFLGKYVYVLILICWSCNVRAQTASNPVEHILEKHIEATGGRDRYQAVRTLVTRAEIKGQGGASWSVIPEIPTYIKPGGRFTTYHAAPNLHAWITTQSILDSDSRGCDGKRAWELRQPHAAWEEKHGEMFDILCAPLFDFPLNWRRFKKFKFRGKKTLRGRDVLVVSLWYDENTSRDDYFDAQSYMLLRTAFHKWGNRGFPSRETVTLTFSDFRNVEGGLIFPFSTLLEWDNAIAGMPPGEVRITSIEVNGLLPAGVFEKPTSPSRATH